MNNLSKNKTGYVSQDCKSYSIIQEDVYNFGLECYYLKNGKKQHFKFECVRHIDPLNYKTILGTYKYTKNI